MDVIIFFKAIGNLLFTAILCLAVVFTAAFSIMRYLLRSMVPTLQNFAVMFRNENGLGIFQLGKKILPQKKF